MQTRYTVKIKEKDIDELGHVTYSSYIDSLMDARREWFKEAGADLENILKNRKMAYPMIHFEITYLKEAFLGDEFTVITKPKEIGNKSFTLEQFIYNRKNELITKSISKHVMFDVENRKSIPVIDEIKNCFY